MIILVIKKIGFPLCDGLNLIITCMITDEIVQHNVLLPFFHNLILSWITSNFQGKLFPTIFKYWQKYQANLLEKVKAIQGGVVEAGDGRHDSMGHSAKFGAYTIFCCTLPMIIHFALIQVGKKSLFTQYNCTVLFLLLHCFSKCNILWMSTVSKCVIYILFQHKKT